jgi:uncharacterized protein
MSQTEAAAMLLDDDSVARYLRNHPDFFERYPGLVSEFTLPHESGAAVSLVERQVSLLRERNIDLRKRLGLLVRAAEDNDRLFAKVRALTLALLDAGSLEDLDDALRGGLNEDFAADYAICYYPGPSVGASTTLLRALDSGSPAPLSRLVQATGVSCGMLRGDEMAQLFDLGQSADGSAVLVALRSAGAPGLLAIGNRDPKHFTPDMGTLFVRYVAEVLSRMLQQLAAAPSGAHTAAHEHG